MEKKYEDMSKDKKESYLRDHWLSHLLNSFQFILWFIFLVSPADKRVICLTVLCGDP